MRSLQKASIAHAKTIAIILVFCALLLAGCSSQPQTGNTVISPADNVPQAQAVPSDAPQADPQEEAVTIDPTKYPVRQLYFEKAFQPRRESYNLFEKAATYLGIPIEKVPGYFHLGSESDIFSDLPRVPKDFGEVAYLLASGRTYAIGSISEEYYKQPEFYPNFKVSGLKYWTEPDPKYWSTNGYGTYPAVQYDTLSLSGRDEFTAVVFFYTGYGVQTYQGVMFVPTAETLENFDITVTPEAFVATPTFPKFTSDWANQILIKGKLKPGTKEGKYTIGFRIAPPPIEKKEEWEFKYRNLYFDAASSLAPSEYPIKFEVSVEK